MWWELHPQSLVSGATSSALVLLKPTMNTHSSSNRLFPCVRAALALLCATPLLCVAGRAARAQDGSASPVPAGMVAVPEGAFKMGTSESFYLNGTDASPVHEVKLPAFYIDRLEVTNAEYKKWCDATNYPPPPHWKGGSYPEGKGDFPVQHVNWYEAQAFARWRGKRLPTEAEWEKAARGTDSRRFPWGASFGSDYTVTGQSAPSAVGTKPLGASPYGALDMAGNVYEWTSDWYDAYPGTPTKYPQFGTIYKVIRGGGYDGNDQLSTTVFRGIMRPFSRSEWVGFRCAQSAK